MVSLRSCKDSNLDRPGRRPDGSGRHSDGSGRLLVGPVSALIAAASLSRGSEAEEDDGQKDQVDGEQPETQTVDDHRRELPVVRLALFLRVTAHASRDAAQLLQQ